MVRTRADAGPTKVSAAKAPRKVLSAPSGGAGSSFSSPGRVSGKEKYSGGNSYNPQPTPEWQKGIGSFFKCVPKPRKEKAAVAVPQKERKPSQKLRQGKVHQISVRMEWKYSGGNSYNPQPTPEWQKGIGSFFKCVPKPQEGEGSSSSSSERKETKPEAEAGEGSSNFSKNGMISDDDE
ncbi:PCNA-associated factor-like [Penaeus indicus]|uniref:PCNA-associated factor-like n=1 Tax=Penaeus indicus TaxID=29960 RepID=UPI00300D310B